MTDLSNAMSMLAVLALVLLMVIGAVEKCE